MEAIFIHADFEKAQDLLACHGITDIMRLDLPLQDPLRRRPIDLFFLRGVV